MSSGWNTYTLINRNESTYTLINRNETPNLSLFCEKKEKKKRGEW